jgi:uncharacterized protein YdiU (UPF0061 family)
MLTLSNTYLQLPSVFYQRIAPTPVGDPQLVLLNHSLAALLGIEASDLQSAEGLAILAGNSIPAQATPLALAYSGHQFGHFVPLLGDGRAVLLGELTTNDNISYDLQLKGSGRTPFSRRGDGRAALGPMMREYIIGEALHALGIPATRTLAVVRSGEIVLRDRPLPGGIQARIARSHIRVGTFEYAATLGDNRALRALAEYAIARHYTDLVEGDDRFYRFAEMIFRRQAALVAQWMLVGFIHGVLNTDNVAISGESLDFGPCAFMNRYDPSTVFSSIDQFGRYAYGAQPNITQWNLARLAESLMPLFDTNLDVALTRSQELVDSFRAMYFEQWNNGLRDKLGLVTHESDDSLLIKDLFDTMLRERLDYTATFRSLCGEQLFPISEALGSWHAAWSARIDQSRNIRAREETLAYLGRVNPAVIARNLLVEEALARGVDHGDFSFATRLVEALKDPFTPHPRYSAVDSVDDSEYRTFCGT